MTDKLRMHILIRELLWRVLFLFLGATIFVASYYYGAALHLGIGQAKIIAEQISTRNKAIDQSAIFFNNIKPAAGMFIPAFGAGLGFYSGYSTGLVISALQGVITCSQVGFTFRAPAKAFWNYGSFRLRHRYI
ncbi:MAG TPA: hypothetical protein VEP90_24600 [Methylomirabilota bacterium]|nr:hypothetical protein [Methylomirabilota bacterium]